MSSNLREEFNSSPDGIGPWMIYIHNETEWGDYHMEEWNAIEHNGKPVLPYFGPMSECPSSVLDREFDNGFGAPERPIFTVWTTNYIGTCTEYDGATDIRWELRDWAFYEKARAE